MENNSVKINNKLLTYELPKPEEKITHLAIGAHPDDVEIFAYNAIEQCYQNESKNFVAIICSNGSGAPVYGEFKEKTKHEIVQIRKDEQQKAARLGQYSGLVHFDLESDVLKRNDSLIIDDIKILLEHLKPRYIFTHNPFDNHKTHRSTLAVSIKALQKIENRSWLKGFYACEVWGSLDWLPKQYKYILGESNRENLQMQLLECFYSQNVGSQKRYDLGTVGRKLGNATFYESDKGNQFTHQSYALDLLDVIHNSKIDVTQHCIQIITDYQEEMKHKLVDLK